MSDPTGIWNRAVRWLLFCFVVLVFCLCFIIWRLKG